MFTYNLPDKYLKINAAALKWLACITMFIDHAALMILYHRVLIPNVPIVAGTQLEMIYHL